MQQTEIIIAALSDSAASLINRGHEEDAVMDAMMALTTNWTIEQVGPRETARRLYMLAVHCAAAAEQVERDRGGLAH